MSEIHATAIVHSGASIGEGTSIGPYSVIGPHVVLGKGNKIGPHVVIEGHTTLGDYNTVFQFASVGSAPQDLKYRGEPSTLSIGDKNIIREYVTLQPGTQGGGMSTSVGNGNLFMASTHVGHDCHIGSSNVFANSAALAGHVTVGDCVVVGGLSGVHQFVHLGNYCLLGAGAMVNKDVPPYCIVEGNRAGLAGLNVVALERRGFGAEEIRLIRAAYRDLFLGSGTLKERLHILDASTPKTGRVRDLIEFVKQSQRGVCSPRKGGSRSDEA
ncbi:MAG: acyl-ACP--UDP-N-acetylglucosamine O-acyltransferase [Oligoflexia bacterium]|nr:acyl-ACP--UDP-N-acetylglucosamine O-acyltransferase [Oligoflexia bacterium]